MIAPEEVVRAARDLIGTPYKDRQHQRGVACDCFGVVTLACEDVGAACPNQDKHSRPPLDEVLEGMGEYMDRLDEPRQGAVVVIAPGRADASRPRLHYGVLTDAQVFSPFGIVHVDRHTGRVVEVGYRGDWREKTAAVFGLREAV